VDADVRVNLAVNIVSLTAPPVEPTRAPIWGYRWKMD